MHSHRLLSLDDAPGKIEAMVPDFLSKKVRAEWNNLLFRRRATKQNIDSCLK